MDGDINDLSIWKMKAELNPSLLTENQQQLQQSKTQVKDKYVFVNSQREFLKNLYMEPDQWPSKKDADRTLKEATNDLQSVKEEVKEVKGTIESLCSGVEEGLSMLVLHKSQLQLKQQELEEKKLELEGRKQQCVLLGDAGKSGQSMVAALSKKVSDIEESIQNCDKTIEDLQRKLVEIEPDLINLADIVQRNSTKFKQQNTELVSQNSAQSQLSQQMNKLVFDLEHLSGLSVIPLSRCGMRVEFQHSGHNTGVELALQLEFTQNNLQDMILKSAKVNVDSIDAKTLLEEAVSKNDVPSLVTKLKSRWFSHQPLLTEMAQLRHRSAVDWIQEENILRVMVGRGGSVVCTLHIPPSYPMSGDVTLTDIKGQTTTESLADIQMAESAKTLTSWVACLEDKFGRP